MKHAGVKDMQKMLSRMRSNYTDCIERVDLERKVASSLKNYFGRTFVVEPKSEHKASMIFCHGLGDSGEGWVDFMKKCVAPRFPFIRFILPTAPVMPVTIAQGLSMNSWFDIASMSIDADEDKIGLTLAAAYVEHIIEGERGRSSHKTETPIKIFLGGFSQGGAVALYTSLLADTGVSGVLCLSGFLPGREHLEAIDDAAVSEMRAKQRFFIAHGACDFVVPIDLAKKSVNFLKNHLKVSSKGIDVHFYHDLAHCTNEKEEDDILAFIAGLL